MGRSSRYVLISDISRSRLTSDLVIERNWTKSLIMVIKLTTTSTDNTETSDADHQKPDGNKKNKKNRRKSKLPWSSSSDVSGEAKSQQYLFIYICSRRRCWKTIQEITEKDVQKMVMSMSMRLELL